MACDQIMPQLKLVKGQRLKVNCLNCRGTGLIEAIVYVATVALFLVVVVNSALSMNGVASKTRLKRNIVNEAGVAVERKVREIRLGDSIVLQESSLGLHPGVLKLNTVVGGGDNIPTTKTFFLSGEVLMMQEGVNLPVPLTSRVKIKRLIFYHVSAGVAGEAVTLELVAEDRTRNLVENQTFNTTAVLRRSY